VFFIELPGFFKIGFGGDGEEFGGMGSGNLFPGHWTRLTSGFVESINEKNQQTCEAG